MKQSDELHQYRWIKNCDLNGFGKLFGGQMLSWVDEDSSMLCYNASEANSHYTTAGYDKASFIKPCTSGDRLYFQYKIVYAGNKSVVIRCRVFNLRLNELVFSCMVTMVRTSGQGLLQFIIDGINKDSLSYEIAETIKEDRLKLDINL